LRTCFRLYNNRFLSITVVIFRRTLFLLQTSSSRDGKQQILIKTIATTQKLNPRERTTLDLADGKVFETLGFWSLTERRDDYANRAHDQASKQIPGPTDSSAPHRPEKVVKGEKKMKKKLDENNGPKKKKKEGKMPTIVVLRKNK
jgi:hypothetical protein